MQASNGAGNKNLALQVGGPPRGSGGPNRTLMEIVKMDLKMCNLSRFGSG